MPFRFRHFLPRREAVRQRKALSRTSSNILLNSVHLSHTRHSAHHSHHMNYLSPSDCDLNLTLKQLRRDSNFSSTSNIEVGVCSLNILFVTYTMRKIPSAVLRHNLCVSIFVD